MDSLLESTWADAGPSDQSSFAHHTCGVRGFRSISHRITVIINDYYTIYCIILYIDRYTNTLQTI